MTFRAELRDVLARRDALSRYGAVAVMSGATGALTPGDVAPDGIAPIGDVRARASGLDLIVRSSAAPRAIGFPIGGDHAAQPAARRGAAVALVSPQPAAG